MSLVWKEMKWLCLFLVRTFRVSSLLRLAVFFLFFKEDLYILKYVGGAYACDWRSPWRSEDGAASLELVLHIVVSLLIWAKHWPSVGTVYVLNCWTISPEPILPFNMSCWAHIAMLSPVTCFEILWEPVLNVQFLLHLGLLKPFCFPHLIFP